MHGKYRKPVVNVEFYDQRSDYWEFYCQQLHFGSELEEKIFLKKSNGFLKFQKFSPCLLRFPSFIPSHFTDPRDCDFHQ